MRSAFLVLAVLCAAVVALPHADAPLRDGIPVIPCMTEELFHYRMGERDSDCTTRGECDKMTVRDTTAETSTIRISTAVHIMQSRTGESPDNVGVAQAESFMNRMNEAYGVAGIQFNYTIWEHADSSYYCIPPYSGTNQDWLNAINDMKTEYAINVGGTMNIFVSCQTPSLQGTLFGIGTFPWDNAATRATGGLWLNSISVTTAAQAEGDITPEHEGGHCLGLWHTFHGADEVVACNLPCEETPHSAFDVEANEVGDFCSDTPATPRNYACSNPSGTACDGTAWGNTDYTNYMGYGMDPQPCGDHFTEQQELRMRCWTCDALGGMVMSGC